MIEHYHSSVKVCLGPIRARFTTVKKRLTEEERDQLEASLDFLAKLLMGPTVAAKLGIEPQVGDCGCSGS